MGYRGLRSEVKGLSLRASGDCSTLYFRFFQQYTQANGPGADTISSRRQSCKGLNDRCIGNALRRWIAGVFSLA